MRGHNAKGRSIRGPAFLMLRYDMIDSGAWKCLTPAQRCVMIQIARRYNGTNNGFLGASVDNLAAECNIAPNTVTSAIARLIKVGFIERTAEGAFGYKCRHSAEFRLTWQKCDLTGHKASDAFKAFERQSAINEIAAK